MTKKSRRALPKIGVGLLLAGAAGLVLWGRVASPETSGTVRQLPARVQGRGDGERPAYDPALAGKTVAFWEQQADRDPQGALERRELARAYLARQRENGDIADAVRAEAAARDSLKILPRNNAAALLSLARALLVQHRFPEALETAQNAAKFDANARRLVADVQIEIGAYDDARRMLTTTPPEADDLNYYALRARLEGIDGNPEGALRYLEEARKRTENRLDLPAEIIAWYSTMIGHLQTESGKLDEAEESFRAALDVFPRDYRAMTGLAAIAAWRGDWRAVIVWGEQAVGVCPQNPESIRLLGDARAAMGQDKEAEQEYSRLEKLVRSFPRIYDRHWARFLADKDQNLDEALALARKDLELRHDIHGYDTLAWVYFKKGRQKEAELTMKTALAHGTREATLFYHAGMIARAGGDTSKAKVYFTRARAVNPRSVPSRWVRWMDSTE